MRATSQGFRHSSFDILSSFVIRHSSFPSRPLSTEQDVMDKWPIGVFASIDAGLGVQLDVAHELGVPTIQLHAPQKATRTKDQAARFLDRLASLGIRVTAVFG